MEVVGSPKSRERGLGWDGWWQSPRRVEGMWKYVEVCGSIWKYLEVFGISECRSGGGMRPEAPRGVRMGECDAGRRVAGGTSETSGRGMRIVNGSSADG